MTRPILVFGAGGRVGQELLKIAGNGDTHTWTDEEGEYRESEMDWCYPEDIDIADRYALMRMVGERRPEAIINLAACTLPLAEQGPDGRSEAHKVNSTALEWIGRVAAIAMCPVVHISTDCVFSGTNLLPYREDAQTLPANWYGESKLDGENALRRHRSHHIIIRTTGVYLRHKPNFLEGVLSKARAGETMEVVADTLYTPTDARELAKAILTATERVIEDPSVSGTYHFAGPDVMSYLDFARLVHEEAGLSAPLHSTTMAEREKIEGFKRPKNAALNSDKFAEVFGLRHRPTRECVRELVNPA